uniref:NADH-ubiquinone oxidoreductase chain 4L n=1 Tax=Cerambycidae sp. 6 KM-2017 TaxID=2219291 RepID=A0A346RGS9_9CUCU|nr:NADH dehydrogenase subunit 4L [Cerambycidae sp. 6 KM-2017]
MLIYIYLALFMSLMGLLMFSMKRKHLLIMLLSVEFVVISIYLNMFIYFSYLNYEYFFTMIFLTMSVCEGALGLSVLVSMIRSHGNDYILSFSSLW